MRHSVKVDQVGHLWVHQAQSHAYCGNVRFEGEYFFSYATPVGRIVQDARGERVALFSAHRYSQTTEGRHKHIMRRAASHLPSFTVPALDAGSRGRHSERSRTLAEAHAINREYLIQEYRDYGARLMRAQSRPRSFQWLEGLAEAARDYCKRFKLPKPKGIDTAAVAAQVTARHDRLEAMRAVPGYDDRRRKAREAREALQERKRQEAAEKVRREHAEALSEWRAGLRHSLPYSYSGQGKGAALRLSLRRDVVQTSLGAEVPAADASRACAFVASVRERGQEWQRNGATFKVGAFQLDKVTAGGDVKAGCHFIEWAEVEALAAVLGSA